MIDEGSKQTFLTGETHPKVSLFDAMCIGYCTDNVFFGESATA